MDSEFFPLPVPAASTGALRRAGFEFEFAEVGVRVSAKALQELFGGRIVEESMFVHRLRDSRVGDFKAEIDTSILKEKKYEPVLRSVGFPPDLISSETIEESLLALFSRIVPYEIVTPPLPPKEFPNIETLRERLRAAGAIGTRTSLLYAFGLHINIEIAGPDPEHLRDILRAFILLYPWLKRAREVDFSRRIAPYIDPFPREYGLFIMSPDYEPTLEELVDDYLRFNPTRNRALDMIPCFAGFFPRVLEHQEIEGLHLVSPRPAFHYRLPNCMIDEEGWRICDEWNAWVELEQLAVDRMKLEEMTEEYLSAERQLFNPFQSRWSSLVHQYM